MTIEKDSMGLHIILTVTVSGFMVGITSILLYPFIDVFQFPTFWIVIIFWILIVFFGVQFIYEFYIFTISLKMICPKCGSIGYRMYTRRNLKKNARPHAVLFLCKICKVKSDIKLGEIIIENDTYGIQRYMKKYMGL